MFNNEYIAKAGRNSIYKGVQEMQDSYREWVKSSELEQIMKYIGFQPHHGERYNGEVFLSSELEIAVVESLSAMFLINSVCR